MILASPIGSLRARMLVSAALVLVVFLGVMGLVLDNAYRESARQSVSERLLLQIYALIAATVEEPGQGVTSVYLPENLQEPLFNTMGSGLFGVVFDEAGVELWRSQSAVSLTLTDAEIDFLMAADTPGMMNFSEMPANAEREPLFVLTYPIIWQGSDERARYTYAVLQHFEPYSNEVAAFRNNLWGWLVAGVIVLVGLQAAIMNWGLRPIAGLEKDLKAIEGGQRDYLEGDYPKEIAGVTRSLNLLLAEERRQRERYRTTLADLAHSLKTPLAILKGEASRPEPAVESMTAALDEQVDRMNEIVSYQLERALVKSSPLVRSSVSVAPVLGRLVSAMRRVYVDKAILIETDIEEVDFPGDERDLMELLGNILDNACKYGRSVVRVRACQESEQVLFIVEDDGPGIDEADHRHVLERGARLDTRQSGQGIGLAVVAEIVQRHGGEIRIDRSALGGARLTVSF